MSMRSNPIVSIVAAVLFTAAGLQAGAPAYPLKVGPTGRYLTDQKGVPFLMHGDTPWSLIAELSGPDAELYLDDRRQKGFNSIIVNLIEHKFSSNPPNNKAGDPPFLTPGDFAAPNESYFSHADRVIRLAAERGMQVLLAPCYLGYKGMDEGFYEEVKAAGREKCRAYGRFVGSRYRNFDNLIWLIGGDRNPEDVMPQVLAMAEGIRETDDRHLFTAHTAPEYAPADVYAGEPWLSVNNTYTYKLVHDLLFRDYFREPVRPFFLIESTYEGEHNASAAQIRRQAYWAVLCGGCGQFFGNRPIWLFAEGWKEALNARGSRDMAVLKSLFLSRKWHDLVPDRNHEALTSGLGEFNGLDYLAAALTSDRSTLIAYMPSAREVTVDLSKIAGSRVKAWWFDPQTGTSSPAGNFETRGPRPFTPPDSGDWILVVDDASRGLPAPGTADP
jgi:hypothetical protein